MKVKCTKPEGSFGFYGGLRRRRNDIFELESEKHFSNSWMEKIDGRKIRSKKTEVKSEGVSETPAEQ